MHKRTSSTNTTSLPPSSTLDKVISKKLFSPKQQVQLSNTTFDILHIYKNKENQVQFNEYLKQCREKNHLTIETTTISKWERGVAKPHISRQVAIIKYFQKKTGTALPCWENYTVGETEEQICKAGMRNLIGKSKKFIYDFPSEMMHVDDMKIYPLRNA